MTLNTRKAVLECDGRHCGSDTFNIIRLYDYDTKKITHQTACALCGKLVTDPNEILPAYHVSLGFETIIKGRTKEEAIQNARQQIVDVPSRAEVRVCEEVGDEV